MSRGIGEIAFFQDLVPESLAFPVALATQLGALWFAGVILFLLYRYHDRERAIIAGGVLVAGTGIWRTIKIVFPVPRPEQPMIATTDLPFVLQPLFDLAVVDSGPGFPSGHAVTTTILYLSLASYLSVSTRPKRYAGAVFFIGLVGFTRITLGVHYLVDVIAGAAIGHSTLLSSRWIMKHATEDSTTIALKLGLLSATVCLLANLLVPPFSLWEVGLFAAGAGAFIWWEGIVHERWTPPVAESSFEQVRRWISTN